MYCTEMQTLKKFQSLEIANFAYLHNPQKRTKRVHVAKYYSEALW